MSRLKIGSYVIDTTAANSTTSGVRLDLSGDETGGIVFTGSTTGGSFAGFFVSVSAASEAALKTAVAAVVDKINNVMGQDIVYEETTGTTQWDMLASDWPEVVGEYSVSYGALSAKMAVGFTASRPAAQTSGAGDEPGQAGPINWQYEQTTNDSAACVVKVAFQGDSTNSARQHMLTYVNKMSNTANYPSWLPTSMRLVGKVWEFEQQPNQTSPVPELAYNVGLLTLTFQEMAAALEAAGTLDNFKTCSYMVSKTKRAPIDIRSGLTDPGHDVVIAGTMVLATEGNTTWNSSDSAFAAASIRAAALSAIASIRTDAEARMGVGAFVQLGEVDIDIGGINGEVAFTGHYITGSPSRVMSWEETGVLANADQVMKSRATNGAETIYRKAGGPERTFTHSLTATGLGVIAYKMPPLNANWERVGASIETPKQEPFAGAIGVSVYKTVGSSSWVYVNPGPTGPMAPPASGASVTPPANVGSGRI